MASRAECCSVTILRPEIRLQTDIKEGEMDMSKVAINGMGRIGRAVLRIVLKTPKIELAAVNDLMPAQVA